MRILSLDMKHFGKFQEHTMKFQPGMNIIYGGNESGKSTVHAFIRAMLFGIERRGSRGGRPDEYALRQPWENPAWFAGAMRVEYGRKVYRIERNFYSGDKGLQLICETDGVMIEDPQEAIYTILSGMHEAAFCNTVFIPQAGAKTEKVLPEQLRDYMLRIQETGDGSVNVGAAIESLRKRKRELEQQKKAQQEELDKEIAQKKLEISYLQSELTKSSFEDARSSRALQRSDRPGREVQPSVQPEDGSADRVRQDTERRESGRSGGSREADDPQRSIIPYLWAADALCLIAFVLSYACVFAVQAMAMRILLFVLGTVFAGTFSGLFAYLIRYTRHARNRSARAARGEQTDTGSEDGYGRSAISQRQRNTGKSLAEEGQSSAEEEDGARMAERALVRHEEAERIRQTRRVQIRNAQAELDELYRKSADLSAGDRDIEALDLAMLRIREISGGMVRETGREFERNASRILSELTEGRYTAISLDEKLEVRLNTPDRLLYLSQVSYAAMNQVYFALRMAAGELLGGRRLPIILDETFSMYDDDRLAAALRYLEHCGRQVILFTSQTRENDMLRGAEL